MASAELIEELAGVVSSDRVIRDAAELFVYESDGFTIAHNRPAAVVFPVTTEEVAAVVKVLVKHEVQIVPRGSGTGLAGGCVAYNAGVVGGVGGFCVGRVCACTTDANAASVVGHASGHEVNPKAITTTLPLKSASVRLRPA